MKGYKLPNHPPGSVQWRGQGEARFLNAKLHWLVTQNEPPKRDIKKDERGPAFLQVGF